MRPFVLIMIVAIVAFAGMIFYLLGRFASFFGKTFRNIPIRRLISLVIMLAVIGIRMIRSEDSKVLSIIGTAGSWLFILTPVLFLLAGTEQLLSLTIKKILNIKGDTKKLE